MPVRLATRKIWVSTAMVGSPKARSAPHWRSCGRRRAAPPAPRARAAPRRHVARPGSARERDDVLGLDPVKADRPDLSRRAPLRQAPASSPACRRPANRAAVALLTPASVACAESTTATRSVKGSTDCSSLLGLGRCGNAGNSAIWSGLSRLALAIEPLDSWRLMHKAFALRAKNGTRPRETFPRGAYATSLAAGNGLPCPHGRAGHSQSDGRHHLLCPRRLAGRGFHGPRCCALSGGPSGSITPGRSLWSASKSPTMNWSSSAKPMAGLKSSMLQPRLGSGRARRRSRARSSSAPLPALRGRGTEIGRFLSPAERKSFARP